MFALRHSAIPPNGIFRPNAAGRCRHAVINPTDLTRGPCEIIIGRPIACACAFQRLIQRRFQLAKFAGLVVPPGPHSNADGVVHVLLDAQDTREVGQFNRRIRRGGVRGRQPVAEARKRTVDAVAGHTAALHTADPVVNRGQGPAHVHRASARAGRVIGHIGVRTARGFHRSPARRCRVGRVQAIGQEARQAVPLPGLALRQSVRNDLPRLARLPRRARQHSLPRRPQFVRNAIHRLAFACRPSQSGGNVIRRLARPRDGFLDGPRSLRGPRDVQRRRNGVRHRVNGGAPACNHQRGREAHASADTRTTNGIVQPVVAFTRTQPIAEAFQPARNRATSCCAGNASRPAHDGGSRHAASRRAADDFAAVSRHRMVAPRGVQKPARPLQGRVVSVVRAESVKPRHDFIAKAECAALRRASQKGLQLVWLIGRCFHGFQGLCIQILSRRRAFRRNLQRPGLRRRHASGARIGLPAEHGF